MEFVSILRQGNKSRSVLIEQTFATMIHKFAQNLEIWKLYLCYLLDQIAQKEKETMAKEEARCRKTFEDMLAQVLFVFCFYFIIYFSFLVLLQLMLALVDQIAIYKK
jgi:hypothetical protein